MYFKVLLIIGFIVATSAQFYTPPVDNGPRVSIGATHDVTPSMELDASDFLKAAFTSNARITPEEACRVLREQYNNKYSTYLWHVVVYKAYAIQSLKSIELSIGNDHYYLFATKK